MKVIKTASSKAAKKREQLAQAELKRAEKRAKMELVSLVKFVATHPGCTVSEIADYFRRPAGTLSDLLQKCIAYGYIVRDPSGRLAPRLGSGKVPAQIRVHLDAASHAQRLYIRSIGEAWDAVTSSEWGQFVSGQDRLGQLLGFLDRNAHMEADPTLPDEIKSATLHLRRLARSVVSQDRGEFHRCCEHFRWPQPEAEQFAGFTLTNTDDVPERGMLAAFGYRVGREGLEAPERRKVLAEVYSAPPEDFPFVIGSACSCRRLRAMAYAIAWFIRQARRQRDRNYELAIEHWLADLAYLKGRYYDGRCDGFAWPPVD